ncbi:protein DpdD [Cupriavidus necator]|uniref:protein DpdD n=1 Tax=Cupriavidus necator TaxID=106590 RepID=UPI0005B51ED5|nr:protein DpdD [Cupriavidus necator]
MGSEFEAVHATAAAECLNAFFAPPNRFANPVAPQNETGAASLPDGKVVPAELVDAIRRCLKGADDLPVLLPFQANEGDSITWYACARDKASQRDLRADLHAFIGPTYADFDLAADAATAADAILARHDFLPVPFIASRSAYEARIAGQWRTYWALLQRRPVRRTLEPRTFAQRRAALDRALLAKQEHDVRAAYAALREHHGLSAENRAFLDIRIAAAFGRWEEILAHPSFPHLLKIRLPPETFGDIWDALYEVHLRPLEQQGNAQRLIAEFDQEVRPGTGHLLRTLGRSRRPAALKSFLLHELSRAQPSADLCKQWLSELGDDAFGRATTSVQDCIAALTPRHGLEAARKSMEFERYEDAYDLLWQLPDSMEVLAALLRCAKEIDDSVRAHDVIGRVQAGAAAFQDAIQQKRPRLLADVRSLAGRKPAASLASQLRTEPEDEAAVKDIVEYWRELANTDASTHLDDAMVQNLVQSMEDEALGNASTFDALLPIWFGWLVERTAPQVRFIPLYRCLIEAMQVRDRFPDSELELIKRAALHLVMAGPTPEQYEALMQRLADIFTQVRSPHSMGWGLDLMDGLMIAPVRSEDARLRLMMGVLVAGQEYMARLAPTQKALLLLLAHEVSFTMASEADGMATLDAVDAVDEGTRVMLYSLDSQATQRAANVLRTLVPRLHVTTNSDTECTQRLRQHTSHAKYVVFVSSVATHQAFYCIKSAIRDDDALRQVPGTGTTRIVETVLNAIQPVR